MANSNLDVDMDIDLGPIDDNELLQYVSKQEFLSRICY